jgi:hypothetical protein
LLTHLPAVRSTAPHSRGARAGCVLLPPPLLFLFPFLCSIVRSRDFDGAYERSGWLGAN